LEPPICGASEGRQSPALLRTEILASVTLLLDL
jgi:hypothetical protein